MSNEQPVIRASPLNSNVAFVTRTSDDAPIASVRGAQVPGFAPEGDAAVADQPCTLKGLSGGIAAGVLGFIFGFVPSVFRNRSIRSIHIWGAEGMASAKAFAVMSGIYTTVQCLCERIRQQDDGINRLIAGGASGVAVAWRSGLVGALQSGVLLAVVSWIFDFGSSSVGSAKAANIGCGLGGCRVSVGQAVSCSLRSQSGSGATTSAAAQGESDGTQGRRRVHLHLGGHGGGAWGGAGLLPSPAQVLRTPVVMWLGPIASRPYFAPPALAVNG